MADDAKRSTAKQENVPHPGSSVEDAKSLGGKGDFGVAEADVIARTYTSTNTKRSDPGGAPPRAGADGSRTSGVGGNASGVGSSSGGDLDTDIVGVGTGGSGIAASGKVHEPTGPDDARPTSRRATDPSRQGVYQPENSGRPRGSTVQRGDDQTTGSVGADAASNTHSDDDSFAGEVSTDEATGRNDQQ